MAKRQQTAKRKRSNPDYDEDSCFSEGKELGQPDPSVALRLLQKAVLDVDTGCWVWTAAVNSRGYGIIREGRRGTRMLKAHRAAYALFVGKVLGGATVDHRCRNRRCINPQHLRLVSHSENATDANVRRGRRHQDETLPGVESESAIDAQGVPF